MSLIAIIDQFIDREYYRILIYSATSGEYIGECEYINGELDSDEHSLYEECVDYSLCFVDGLPTLIVWEEEIEYEEN